MKTLIYNFVRIVWKAFSIYRICIVLLNHLLNKTVCCFLMFNSYCYSYYKYGDERNKQHYALKMLFRITKKTHPTNIAPNVPQIPMVHRSIIKTATVPILSINFIDH